MASCWSRCQRVKSVGRLKVRWTASVAFRSYIANAKIGGVFQGQPTRVLINGRIVRPGDTVDEKLAITFIEVEAVDRLLVFKDVTDARVTRRY